jgi:hypothetical protein
MSGVEPGPNGTTIRTVFGGQSCACAAVGIHSSAVSTSMRRDARSVWFRRIALVLESVVPATVP